MNVLHSKKEMIIDLLEQGYKKSAIANMLNVTTPTVYHFISKYIEKGEPTPKCYESYPPDVEAEIMQEVQKGFSLKSIAQKHNISYYGLRRYLEFKRIQNKIN